MTKDNINLSLIFLWLLIAVIATYSSVVMAWHLGKEMTLFSIFDLSFYHFIPAILWSFLTPILLKLAYRFPLKASNKQHFVMHLGIAIIFAPLIRFVAIYIDFAIKFLSGMNETAPMEVVQDVNLVILATIPQSFAWYWLLIGIGSILVYQDKKKKIAQSHSTSKPNFLTVTTGSSQKILPVEEIDYIQSAGNYVHIHTRTTSFKMRKTLKQLTQELPEPQFFRIHRSILVNSQAIDQWIHWRRGEYLLTMKNKKTLSSSRGYRQQMIGLLHKIKDK